MLAEPRLKITGLHETNLILKKLISILLFYRQMQQFVAFSNKEDYA